MSKTQFVSDVILTQGILPLYFNQDEEVSIEILRSIYAAGIKAVEYTNRGEEALHNFKKLIEVRDIEMPGLLIGIGTVKNLEQSLAFVTIGADFLVSPGFVKEIADYAVKNDIFYAPGCMTPTDIIAAENAGVRFIKLFPGNILGVEFMSTIKDVFPKLKFMPTGGVDMTKESIESWFNAGVSAVGMGSKLISKKAMELRDYDAIKTDTKTVLELIQALKQK
jgi:2-dehydro-3-deoxyphosphogluconate aldolase/(4S)-4-hydroxy-2-oxoglutarate aldolase